MWAWQAIGSGCDDTPYVSIGCAFAKESASDGAQHDSDFVLLKWVHFKSGRMKGSAKTMS